MATWPGSTNRTRVVPSGAAKQPQEALAVAVLAADDLLLPLVPLVHADELVQHGLHFGRRRVGGGRPGLATHAVAVAAADDVADAVFVAVDGEGVAGGQRAALAANFGQLRLVEDHAGGSAGAELAAEAEPARAVGVVESVVAIDEAVPEFVEGLGQLPRQQVRSRGLCPWGWGSMMRAPW